MPSQASSNNAKSNLILVRHGETEGQSSIRYYGRTDLALDERGRAQMRAAARALENEVFSKVFASSMRRATEGARIIAGDGPPIVAIDEFVEIDFGKFEGLTLEEIREAYPEEFVRWRRMRLEPAYQYPDGESGAAFQTRVISGMERMFRSWRESCGEFSGTALLVAHRGVIRVILEHLIGAAPAIELGSIHILECGRDGWRARALDLTGHLEDAC
jgi:broad specificity phosphatase PhoE